MNLITIIGFIFTSLMLIGRRIRFYIFSYFFSWLYTHRRVSAWLGIEYRSDLTWRTNRHDTEVYKDGVLMKLFAMFNGMDLKLDSKTFDRLWSLQGGISPQVDMRPYFDRLQGAQMSLAQFENFLSRTIAVETNRLFGILPDDILDKYISHMVAIREIGNCLGGDKLNALKLTITEFWRILEVNKIIKLAPKYKRPLLTIPQYTLISGFSALLISGKKISEIEIHHFFKPMTGNLTFISKSKLIFMEWHYDTTPDHTNRAFGPNGFKCPGSIFAVEFIKSILDQLKIFDISIRRGMQYAGNQFISAADKEKIIIRFGQQGNSNPRILIGP